MNALHDPPATSAKLAGLFPPGTVVAELRRAAALDEIDRSEAALCSTFSPKRQVDFAGGRLCARFALEQLSRPAVPLLIDADRRPTWPPDVVGSITHTGAFCAAAVARRSILDAIGIDAESIDRVTSDLWPQILRPDELDHMVTLTARERQLYAATVFSGKEAFYKCQFEKTRAWLGFEDVSIDVVFDEPGAGSLRVRPVDPHALPRDVAAARGRFCIVGDLVVTGFTVHAREHADDAA